jgi:hypothetical protein
VPGPRRARRVVAAARRHVEGLAQEAGWKRLGCRHAAGMDHGQGRGGADRPGRWWQLAMLHAPAGHLPAPRVAGYPPGGLCHRTGAQAPLLLLLLPPSGPPPRCRCMRVPGCLPLHARMHERWSSPPCRSLLCPGFGSCFPLATAWNIWAGVGC